MRQVILLKDHYQKKHEVKDHIEALLRILFIQFEDEREDKDFDSGIRIILHSSAIQNILKLRTYSLSERLIAVMKSMESNQQDNSSSTKEALQNQNPLPVIKEERYKLLEDQISLTDEPLVFSLPVKSTSTCWNSILTKQQKDNLILMAKCGDCSCYHEFPKCDKCKSIRMQSEICQSCRYIKKEEGCYSSYYGNCFQEHELPNCVKCQHFRLKAGRHTNCRALGPDDIQWNDSCFGYRQQLHEVTKQDF